MKSVHLLLVMLLLPGMLNAQTTMSRNEITKNKEVKVSTIEANKEVIRKLYDQSLNKRNRSVLQEIVSEQYTGLRGEKGIAAFEEPLDAVMNAVPDAQWKIEELIGEDDKVVVRQKLVGTHMGTFQNFSATGNSISNDGIVIYEFENGKITHAQVHTDRLGFLQQLEVLPLDLSLQRPTNTPSKDEVNFIDKFFVPETAKAAFLERVDINRAFIKNLPGFVKDAAYEYVDADGNLTYVTIAVWANEDALKMAKELVQAEYKKQGFNPAEMFERLNITMERGSYKSVQ